MFNKTYKYMMENPEVFQHPTTVANGLPNEEFRTIAWNSSWVAADIASRGLNHLLSEAKHYVKPKGD